MGYWDLLFIVTILIAGCGGKPLSTQEEPQRTVTQMIPTTEDLGVKKSLSPEEAIEETIEETINDAPDSPTPTIRVSKSATDTDESNLESALPSIKKLSADDAIPIPDRYNVLAQTRGDLDGDGVPELVTVFNYKKNADDAWYRELRVYRVNGGEWEIWQKTRGGLLDSDSGGMWGDPFDSIVVKRGAIVIAHYGGSRDRWGVIHRFRFQTGAFRLIGATVDWSTPGESEQNLDINFSTGRAVYTERSEIEDPNKLIKNRDFKYRKFECPRLSLPTIDEVYPGETSVEIPGTDTTMTY